MSRTRVICKAWLVILGAVGAGNVTADEGGPSALSGPYLGQTVPGTADQRPLDLAKISESCPSLSADGKYLFFSRYDEDGGIAQIYWADAEVISNARDRQITTE